MKALADAFFHRVSQAAWLANRTGGKTRNFSLLHHANSTFNDALWTLHAATQEEQALQCKQYLEECFSADWFAPLALGKPAASVRRYTNRARVTVRPGTINAFSGPKPQVLGLDEVEFLPWLNFQQSIGMPHSTDAFPALLLLGSTRQRTHGTMQRLTDNAARMGLEMYTWCVPPGTGLVMADGSTAPIEDVRIGDKVLTAWGRPKPVTRRWVRTVRESLVQVTVSGLPDVVAFTAEHRIVTRRGMVPAGQLRIGDQLLDPAPRFGPGGSWREGWLVGFYAADGCLTKTGNGVMLASNDREVDTVVGHVKAWWTHPDVRSGPSATGPRIQPGPGRGRVVVAYHPKLRALVKRWVVGTATNKRLRRWPSRAEFAAGLLEGWLAGDGWRVRGPNQGKHTRIGQSSSEALAWQMFRLATALGYATSLRRYDNRGGPANRMAPTAKARRVTISAPALARRGQQALPTMAGLWRTVRALSQVSYEGPVYDVTVADDHTFCAGGIAVSNCVWEVMEPCQTRSKDCPLWERCRGGQLCQNPDGFMKVRDVIQKAALWDDEAWETQGLCQRPSRRGLVYWMLDPAVHVHSKWDYRPTLPVYLAADWGYSSPASIGFYQDTAEAGWKFDEIYITHQLGEQLLGLVLEKQKHYGCRFACGWGDPENAEHNARFRKGLAIPWLAGNNVIEEKVRAVRAHLRPAVGPPTLFFHPRCVNTLREFNLYHQRETGTLADGTPTYAEDPVDEENHAMDELAYYCWGRRREHRLSMADSIIVTPTGAPPRFPGDAASGPGPAQRPTGKAW